MSSGVQGSVVKGRWLEPTKLHLGTGLRWGLTCDGLASHSGGANDFHPLCTIKTGNKSGSYTGVLGEIYVIRASYELHVSFM